MSTITEARVWIIAPLLAALCIPAFSFAQEPPTPATTTATAEEHVGKGLEALRQDRYDAAVEEFTYALRIDPKLALRARFPMAIALFDLHKNADARRELETVQREAGNHPNISYYLGRVDIDNRDFKSAIENLTKAAMAAPFPDTSYYLGFAYSKAEDWKAADKWLNKAARDLPNDARVPFQLSVVYRKQGRNDEAQSAATLAEDIRRQQDDASRLRNDCAKKLDQGPREEAREFCDQLYDPDDPDKLTELGTIYAQHGDLESATKPLTRAAELSPKSPQMLYNLALVEYQLTRYEEARDVLSPALKRWPDLFQLNALMGGIELQLGATQQAYTALHHAYHINPRDSGTGDMLFEACMSEAGKEKTAKQYSAAMTLLQEAASVRPVEPMPHREMAEIYRLTGKPDNAKKEDATADQLAAVLLPPK